jgi:hypothetical protein
MIIMCCVVDIVKVQRLSAEQPRRWSIDERLILQAVEPVVNFHKRWHV